MLLRIAEALRDLSVDVTVLAPSHPPAVVEEARRLGLQVEVLDAHDRLTWMLALRTWDRRHRDGLLWCNGLGPAVATFGFANRVVHLHQHPTRLNRILAALARIGARETLVPSQDMLRSVRGARVLPNWTLPFEPATRKRADTQPFVVGYLGRLSADKGVHVLAEALRLLEERRPGEFRLRLGGLARFVRKKGRAPVEAALAAVEPITEKLGWVAPADLFDSVDVLVVPSMAPESFGLTAAEAMAASVPVIVTDAGALPEVVGQDHALVVPAGDAVALAARIEAVAAEHASGLVDDQLARWEAVHSPAAGRERVASLIEDLGIALPARVAAG
ncbi:glycosyltransferase [Microbacterium sp. SD291]|nr:glycosyltransferase [Microbacterium sp. SD291]